MNNIELADPANLSAARRAAEIAMILAAAIVRSSPPAGPKTVQIELGFLPDQSVHTTPSQQDL